MARIDVILPEELEERFREEVFKRYGMKRGNITQAVQEAVRLWMETSEREKARRREVR